MYMASQGFSHTPIHVDAVNTQYRKITTQIPVPESIPLLEKMYSLESRSMHGQLPIIWDRASDFQVFDPYGNVWIDFTSTIFVANAGHANNRVTGALKRQLDKPLIHTYTYASKERIDYLEYLINNTPKQFEKAFLLSAGTEATETALKLMRLNGEINGKRKGGVICFNGAFHGRTMGAQMMTGNDKARDWIGYQDPNIYHLPFPYPWNKNTGEARQYFRDTLEQLIEDKGIDPDKELCGFMLETFQGWGAVFYPQEFVEALVEFSHDNNMLVAFDEMQAGFGRTGKLFGYMHYGVEPDLLCLGKGASSGLPLSIVLGTKKVMDLPDIGSMSSTHSANPLCCVAGHETLKAMLDDGLVENSRRLGEIFHKSLNEIKKINQNTLKYVFGKGLLASLLFIDENGQPLSQLCDKISEKAMQRGLLVVHTGRESIKLAPPLSITESALMEGVAVLEECIKDSVSELI
jgi:4-aminobutyrate aminotransferase / (S)-3-amino-2-methylpropionate transaminase / 5-aminovalerate transaminase